MPTSPESVLQKGPGNETRSEPHGFSYEVPIVPVETEIVLFKVEMSLLISGI